MTAQQIRKQQQAAIKRKRDQRRRELKRFDALVKKYGYLDLCKRVYKDIRGAEPDSEIRKERELFYLCAEGDSYLWYEIIDGKARIVTSKHVEFCPRLAYKLLKDWYAGNIQPGAEIGQYTYYRSDDKTVTIGCHCIPIVNLDALYEKLKEVYGG